MLGIAYSLENRLPSKLQIHKYKAEEIDLQRLCTGADYGSILCEDMEDELWQQQYHPPCHGVVDCTNKRVEADTGFYPSIRLRAVIGANHWLCAVDDTGNRQHEDIPDGVDHSHDPHIHVIPVKLQYGIGGHLCQTIGSLHNEICCTKP